MIDDPQLVRHWMLLRMLSSRRNGISLADMARETGRGRKTIRRDINFFRLRGVRLTEDVVDRGRKLWKLEKLPAEADHSLNFLEAYAASTSQSPVPRAACGNSLVGVRIAFKKIKSSLNESCDCLPRPVRRYDPSHRTAAERRYSRKAEVIDALDDRD